MAEPAYRRLQRDERRELLLARATELFAQHGYEGLSMSGLAREAKISKALLYHYFPSKQRLFQAALQEGAEELRARTEPDPGRPPAEQLATTLDAFLRWVQERPTAYVTLLQSGAAEVREIVAEVHETTASRILTGLGTEGERPATRAAVHGWLGFLDAAILDWIAHGDLPREELHGMLLGAFAGALIASGASGGLPSEIAPA
jgi:AcrR family transcriptional regulator